MASRKATINTASLILVGCKPVLGVTEVLSSAVVDFFQLIFSLLEQAFSWFFYLLDLLLIKLGNFLGFVVFKIIPGIGNVVLVVMDFIWNVIILGIKSIFNVTVYSYETLMQLNWQLYFHTFTGYILKLLEVIMNLTALVVGVILYVLLRLIDLIYITGMYLLTFVQLVVVSSWKVTARVVEVVAGGVVGTAELVSSGTSSLVASEALKTVVTVVFYFVGLFLVLVVLIQYKPHRKVSRWLKLKFQVVPRQREGFRANLEHHEDVRFVPRNVLSPDTRMNRYDLSPRNLSPSLRHRYHSTLTDQRSIEHDRMDILTGLDEQNKVCFFCFENPPKVIIDPCGHCCLCFECRNEVRRCPQCNVYIRNKSLVSSLNRTRFSASSNEDIRWGQVGSDQTEQEKKRLEKELSNIKKQLEKEEESKLCAVCFDKPRTLIVKPCKHYCLCEDCRNKLSRCPICNREIRAAEKIFNV